MLESLPRASARRIIRLAAPLVAASAVLSVSTVARADEAASASAPSVSRPATIQPPRIDGTYVGGTIGAGGSVMRVNDLPTDSPFVGQVVELQLGQTVFPWLALGFSLSGGGGRAPEQVSSFFGLRVDMTAIPIPRKNLSMRLGFGFGAGSVQLPDDEESKRYGFGGGSFHAALRYTFFPWANKRRSTRGGGFGLAPEIGWIAHPPAAAGRPMANTIFVGLASMFYFGH